MLCAKFYVDKSTTLIIFMLLWANALLGVSSLAAQQQETARQQETSSASLPLEPDQALSSFQLAAGLRIELVASEPDVVDPVAIRFDEEGRMWVVEMGDYPEGPPKGKRPTSRIRILEDRDGDGRYETSHIFADQLLFPTGLQPWRGGVFVTLAGQIVYMKDTDGDHRADLKQVWFSGFAEMNTQLRANHPTLGLDGRVYVANGLRGGAVVSSRTPDREPLELRGHDFRFDPLTQSYETVAGCSQFGMTLDDFGLRFLCSNRNPLMHVVLENDYARRNPNFALPAVIEDVALAGGDSRVFPICRSWTTSLQHAGQFTAACGSIIFRGDRLLPEMVGNAFVCEPTGSLVHREILQPKGATFRSRPAREGVEFLASRDEWFRPVDLATGPDGALYVVDMYRAVIEHPRWMPDELRKRPDLRDGDDLGRIYRVIAKDNAKDNAKSEAANRENSIARPKMSSATGEQLVAMLAHRNGWRRDTAARLLLERGDRTVGESLRTLARDAELPASRVAALRLLSNFEMLSREDVLGALGDSHPGVRRQAVVMGEAWPDDSVRNAVLKLTDDADPQVRFQVVLSLAPMTGHAEIDALKQIALAGAEDPWMRRAVAISAASSVSDLIQAMLGDSTWQRDGFSTAEQMLLVDLAKLVGSSADDTQSRDVVRALVALSKQNDGERLQQMALHAMFQAGKRHRKTVASLFDDGKHESLRADLNKVFESARQLAERADAAASDRCEAVTLLSSDLQSLDLLVRLALDEPEQPVRLGAIGALAIRNEIEPWKALLAQFPYETPVVRRAILDAVAPSSRAALLLDAMESGEIEPGGIDRMTADRLVQHRDSAIRKRAAQILSAAIPKDRQSVLTDYQAALELASDPNHGQEVFSKQCATCHKIAGIGVRVGPDIGDTYSKKREQLLTDILQPNRAIDANYMGYSVLTEDGRILSGLLVAESASSITLQQEEDKTVTLTMGEVEEIRPTGISLMPDGLEENISHQDMADLISFLKNWRYLDGRTPYDDDTKGK